MEFFTVKFFKRTIIFSFLILLIAPSIFCIYFATKSYTYKQEIASLQYYSDSITKNSISDDPYNTMQSFIHLSNNFDYQNKYSSLYVSPPTDLKEDTKVAYLTFDDGPSIHTIEMLDILDKYNIKATFFLTGDNSEKYPSYVKEIYDRGHKVGVHSYSHNYNIIYSDVDNFLEDFEEMSNTIEDITGDKPDIYRFPGGSINNYNRHTYQEIIAEMTRRGYVYFDWNVSSADVSKGTTSQQALTNVISGAKKAPNSCVILLHDRNDITCTPQSLENMILGLIDLGFTFDKLENNCKQYSFNYLK